jgi:diaminopimelate epimerase
MHGTGNDFLVVDGRVGGVEKLFEVNESGLSSLAFQLGHRRFGLGFDQLLLIVPPTEPSKADIYMKIFNCDGSPAGMCGNGIRCASFFAKYLANEPLQTDSFKVETQSRVVTVWMSGLPRTVPLKPTKASLLCQEVVVKVDMGFPDIQATALPVTSHDTSFVGYSISMGNPHYVIFLPDQKDAGVRIAELSSFPVTLHGPCIENNVELFPEKTNVEFVTTSSSQPDAVRMRVWERGSGETLSCGSGACSVGAASIVRATLLNKPIDNHKVTVHLPGGLLDIEWNPEVDGNGDPLHPLFMTGPATLVGKAEIQVFVP